MISGHEVADALAGNAAQFPPILQVGDELCVVDRLSPEPAFGHVVDRAERLDMSEQLFHWETYSAGFVPQSIVSAGFVPKLCGINPRVNHAVMMAAGGIDIELVKRVLSEATKDPKVLSQRGLAKLAGLKPDAVRDILRGENKNPTIATLAPLAKALGKPLSVFGLHFVTQQELRDHIYDVLPRMPTRSRARQAQFLSEAVSEILSLPEDPAPDQAPSKQ